MAALAAKVVWAVAFATIGASFVAVLVFVVGTLGARLPYWGEAEPIFEAARLRRGLPLFVDPHVGAIDLGTVNLITKAHLLEDVIVRQQIAAIRMKGDTVEYKADSFKVRPGASIEEMMRTVPGFQVKKRQLENDTGPRLVAMVRAIEGAVGLR